MKILLTIFCLSFICYNVKSQTDPCPGGTTFRFNELNPTINKDAKTLTYTSFDCMSCQYSDNGVNCKCRKVCGNNEECLKKCGDIVPPAKGIRGYSIKVEVWYSSVILTTVPPPMTAPFESFQDENVQGNALPTCYIYRFSSNWSGFKSLCVKANVAVSYTDGTCCVYQDRICQEIN